MAWTRLRGLQYVRLAPGAAERVAPYLGVAPDRIVELVLDVPTWPDAICPAPRMSRDGRLIAGDPLLVDAIEAGLLFAGAADSTDAPASDPVLVPWNEISDVQVLGSGSERSALSRWS